MKNLFTSLFVVALLFVAFNTQAQAPKYAPQTLLSAMTITNDTAYTPTSAVIDCRKQDSICIQVTWGAELSEKHSNTLAFVRSVDGTTYGTGNIELLELGDAVDPDAGTARAFVGEITANGAGYIKLLYTTNMSNSDTDFTNYVVKYGIKISSP